MSQNPEIQDLINHLKASEESIPPNSNRDQIQVPTEKQSFTIDWAKRMRIQKESIAHEIMGGNSKNWKEY